MTSVSWSVFSYLALYQYNSGMWQKIWHKWLRIPYSLHVTEFRRPKQYDATIILLHGIGSSAKMWQKLAPKLPDATRVIAVDLLGFGNSPKPTWQTYRARTQADCLAKTLVSMGITGPVIIVGHSLGALVAVEFARRYRILVRQLVLVSPPFYRPIDRPLHFVPHRERDLRTFYKLLHDNPNSALKLLRQISRLYFANRALAINEATISAFLATLEAAISNQTSFSDALRLRCPTQLLLGRLDMVVIPRNAKYIARHNPRVTLRMITAGHEITGLMQAATIDAVTNALRQITRPPRRH